MSLSIRMVGATLFAAVSLALVGVAPASATTFCVPGFHAGCPDNDSNVNEPSLEDAMDSLGADGEPDRIIIDATTLTTPDSFYPQPAAYSDDPLEIVGAGVDKTTITSSGFNAYVLNFADSLFRQRKVTVRDLTLLAPAAGSVALAQAADDVFDGVNFESRDQTSGGAAADGVRFVDGGVLRDIRVFGSAGGIFGRAFSTGSNVAGNDLEITGSDISDAGAAVVADTPAKVDTTIRNSRIDVDGQVLDANGGDQDVVENSVIEAGAYIPFYATGNSGGESTLMLRNNTIVRKGNASTAIAVGVAPAATDSASVTVTDSIIRDFPSSWAVEAPVSPSVGDANLDVSYSNISSAGTKTGDGAFSATQGVINQDPQFEGAADYHLAEGSPSIDAGNPAAGGLLTDFEGTIRPLDGDGDGSKVRDQGAYEAPTLTTCANDPTICPDETGPKISKVKFRHGRSPKKGGTLKFKVSESSTSKVTFKPIPARKGKKKRKTRKFTKVTDKAANVTIRIKKGKLLPGKYRLTIKSIDDSGNKSKPVVRKVRVKAKKP